MTTTVLNKLTTTRPLRGETRPLSIADLEEILGQWHTTEPAQPTVETRRHTARATTKLELPSEWLRTEIGAEQGRK